MTDYYVNLIVTGMTTFTPGSSKDPVLNGITFVMLNNFDHSRVCDFDKQQFIPVHESFMAFDWGTYDGKRLVDIQIPHSQGDAYAACLLFKERLTIAEAPTSGEVTFDLDSMAYIADIREICPGAEMDQYDSTHYPNHKDAVGGQFVVAAGRVSADPDKTGRRSVRYTPFCTGVPLERTITNTLFVKIPVDVADQRNPYITVISQSLDGAPGADPLKLNFKSQAQSIDLWIGSTPLNALQNIPIQEIEFPEIKFEVDFEIYYDLCAKAGLTRSIPQYLDDRPVLPGTDRCPPLQNGG